MHPKSNSLRDVTRNFAFVLVLIGLSLSGSQVRAQQYTMSYQGTLTQNESPVSDGLHQLTVTLYSDPFGNETLWTDTYTTEVKNGIFNLQLGSGKSLPDSKTLDRAVWVGVSVYGTAEMRPMTKLGVVPIALNVADKSITAVKISDELMSTIVGSRVQKPQNDADDWTIGGDPITSTQTPTLGTTSGSASGKTNWKIIVNSQDVLRFQEDGTNTPNIIGGSGGNSITSGLKGAVIAGGGTAGGGSNAIFSDYSFIGGGNGGNTIRSVGGVIGGGSNIQIEENSDWSIVVGGYDNNLLEDAEYSIIGGGHNNGLGTTTSVDCSNSGIFSGEGNNVMDHHSVVAGGYNNDIWDGAPHSFIGGGYANGIYDERATIAGGEDNRIEASSELSFIGGGRSNKIESPLSAIAGGDTNNIKTSSTQSFIGGGHRNVIYSPLAVIGGGDTNTIHTSSEKSIIGGGELNYIEASHSVLGGGYKNRISDETLCVLGGGFNNFISATEGAIVGGDSNQILLNGAFGSFLGGGKRNTIYNARLGTLGGGEYNRLIDPAIIDPTRALYPAQTHSFIGGGNRNTIWPSYGTIGGGDTNTIHLLSPYGTIGGGFLNLIDTSSPYGFIGGGKQNSIWESSTSVIAGGEDNSIYPGGSGESISHNLIGGGIENQIFLGSFSSILGGESNTVTGIHSNISGGKSNFVSGGDFSVIGGGEGNSVSNVIDGSHMTIPGGDGLYSESYAQTVMGRFNLWKGSSVKDLITPGAGIVPTDPLVIVGNGNSELSPSNAFEVSNNGHSIVFHDNTSGVAAIEGGTYQDNVIYGWGIVTGGALTTGFGISSVTNPAPGRYVITLTTNDATNTPNALTSAAITVTPTTNSYLESKPPCGVTVYTTPITVGGAVATFMVKIVQGSVTACDWFDSDFMFHVTGRP